MKKRSEIGKPKETISAPSPAQPDQTIPKMNITCPNCGLSQPVAMATCLACGHAFKVDDPVRGPTIEERPTKPLSNEQTLMENIGKLAYDLKQRDLDITLAQLSSITSSERKTLRAWLDARSPDVTPGVKLILDYFRTNVPIPQISTATNTDAEVFAKDDGPLVVDHWFHERMAAEEARATDVDASTGEEVQYVLGKEMYRVAEFATFDVGPYSASTKVRPNETRVDALNRLRRDLEKVAEIDRIARRDSYIQTLMGIKPALKTASDAIKE